MSMSTHVLGFRPPDKRWREMKAVWDACEAAGLEPENFPDEVLDFFDDSEPDLLGIEVEIETTEWSDTGRSGYELKVSDIPKNVTHIRFYNSW